MAQLELKNICKGFDHPVIDNLSLELEKGEFFVIVGPSGIGKTTLLRCIAGLEKLDQGEIHIEGENITNLPPYKRDVAMTFESYALYPHMTVFQNIANPLVAMKKDDSFIKERVTEISKLLKISNLLERKPHEISGGQKQRTALGRTLASEPKVFLLDEPISHLDAKIRAELRSQFHNLEALREVSTVYVTHDYAEALSLGDRIGVMGNGGLMQIGSANEIYDKPNSLFVAQHLGQPGINSFEAELASEGDSYFAFAGEFKLPIAEEDGKILMGKKISKCHLGIRPQYIQLEVGSKKIETETTVFQGNVDVFEALGSYGVMMVSILGESFTLLTDPEDRYQHNDKVSLKFDPKTFHFFDINSGQNLI